MHYSNTNNPIDFPKTVKVDMNKRIKELADEAAKYSATMFLHTGENGDELFVEKLAELIVLECMEVSLQSSHRDDDMGAIIARNINEHFGVDQ